MENQIQHIFVSSQSVGEIKFDIHWGGSNQTRCRAQLEQRTNGPTWWTGSFLHPCAHLRSIALSPHVDLGLTPGIRAFNVGQLGFCYN